MAGYAILAAVRDVFGNFCIPRERLAVRVVTRPLFPPSLLVPEGFGMQDYIKGWIISSRKSSPVTQAFMFKHIYKPNLEEEI